MEHAPQYSWPHPGAGYRIEPFLSEQDKVQPSQLRFKKKNNNENNTNETLGFEMKAMADKEYINSIN